ncbi:MAG: DNA polymerase III subunit gamma/tau [Alphaproteobacteria bacterium]|nr:DNA polymerase III subunit gamma/tau [Alphaproteobacteria bacterium]
MAEETKYRVLARKYRPQVFKDLIGQDALVRTISNAIAQNKLAQAYILTGIRGVGKTSSARIIARALNCVGADGQGGMTPQPCGVCKHCTDIANDCHVDVIEIDAASNTGVDNVREIIEGAKYNPLSARYKIYIIDEVHMLSKSAFNALLKTLEEPPERLKFIFATTEIRKVPVTILSRCQRFDLRRIESEMLCDYFKTILEKEEVTAEADAVALIAKAADGSVRDGLSLLDQAIAHGDGMVRTEDVKRMLGIFDKTQLFDLYEKLMKGQVKESLAVLEEQYAQGVDALSVAQELLEMTHWLTRVRIVPELLNDISLSEVEKTKGKELSEGLSMAVLTRNWQMLLKGVGEVKFSESPLKTLEMLLIRIAYAAELPTPIEMIRSLQSGEVQKKNLISEVGVKAGIDAGISAVSQNLPVQESVKTEPAGKDISQMADMVELAKKAGKRLLAFQMTGFVRPVKIEKGVFHFSLAEGAPENLSMDIRNFLFAQTGVRWDVTVLDNGGGATLKEVGQEKERKLRENLMQMPIIAETLKTFSGSKIERIFPVEKETSAEAEVSFDE